MGRLEDLEFKIMEDKTRYASYNTMVKKAEELGKCSYMDHIRYMLAIANGAEQDGLLDNLMFIGGLGVLANIFPYVLKGQKKDQRELKVLDWRGTEDIDLVLRSKDFLYLTETAFDAVDFAGRSLSVHNKYTIRGHSFDVENSPLTETHIDVYVPNGNPKDGIPIDGKDILEHHWENREIVNLFGVKVPVLDPVNLLAMKAGVGCGNNSYPRLRDCSDAIHLLAACEGKGHSPEDIRRTLTYKQLNRLRNIVNISKLFPGYLIRPGDEFLHNVILDNNLEEGSYA